MLQLLPLFGAHVTHLRAGMALISRASDLRSRDLGSGATLLWRRDSRRSAQVGHGCHVVGPTALFKSQRAKRDKALFDWLELQHLRDVLQLYRVDCVLDVGANRGQYGRLMRRAGFKGHILPFEPVPEIFEQLSNAARNDDNWHVHQMALGRESGELDMHVVPGSLSSLLPPTEFGGNRYARLREAAIQKVPVRRLDEVLGQLLPPDLADPRILLKLDTQGFDLEAFAGVGHWQDQLVALQSEVALMQIYEGMPRMPESLAVFESAGFEVTGMFPVSREARTARVLEYDCVMVRAEKLEPVNEGSPRQQ